MKTEVITVRVDLKTKVELVKLAKVHRRKLSDMIGLILSDIADKKIKIDL